MPDSPLPELLIPVADPDKLDTALTYGADAVYLGGPELSLRARTGGFSFPQLEQALARAHAQNVRVYFALNLLAWEEHLPLVEQYLDQLGQSAVDGLIVADPGIVNMALRRVPHIPIHLSTQANTSNSASARFWSDLGVHRVNLARELGASRIRAIADHVKNLELEVFVHGAMCMAISGRCLLSAHANARPANLGQCTHPCRFDYKVTRQCLEERLRPGQDMWELVDDGEYTQVMAAEDLCLVTALPWLRRAGVHSLKVEGRMKTTSYLAQVTDIYRTALNDLDTASFRPRLYLDELQQVATRALGTGFFAPKRVALRPALPTALRKNIVAKLLEPVQPGCWLMEIKHRFQATDAVELVLPGLRRPVLGPCDYGLEDEQGAKLLTAHSGLRLCLRCDSPYLKPGIFLRAHGPATRMI